MFHLHKHPPCPRPGSTVLPCPPISHTYPALPSVALCAAFCCRKAKASANHTNFKMHVDLFLCHCCQFSILLLLSPSTRATIHAAVLGNAHRSSLLSPGSIGGLVVTLTTVSEIVKIKAYTSASFLVSNWNSIYIWKKLGVFLKTQFCSSIVYANLCKASIRAEWNSCFHSSSNSTKNCWEAEATNQHWKRWHLWNDGKEASTVGDQFLFRVLF